MKNVIGFDIIKITLWTYKKYLSNKEFSEQLTDLRVTRGGRRR